MSDYANAVLCEFGEDRLVAELTRGLPTNDTVRVGVGDDCAVIGKPADAMWILLKTDAVVEDIHFRPGEDMKRVGWKALCRTLSDIAAMSGWPEHALVTIAAPPRMEVRQLRDFYIGLRKAGREFSTAIVGGETSRSPGPFFCSIALTGKVERMRCLLRSGGKVGDAIYVTGRLGGSYMSGRHLSFTPRLEHSRWLTEGFRLHSMMDISDGLASDLPRLAQASGCGFEVQMDEIPRAPWTKLPEALTDGEDFELLFTMDPAEGERLEPAWHKRFPSLPLTRIGTLVKRTRRTSNFALHGYDHFAQS